MSNLFSILPLSALILALEAKLKLKNVEVMLYFYDQEKWL